VRAKWTSRTSRAAAGGAAVLGGQPPIAASPARPLPISKPVARSRCRQLAASPRCPTCPRFATRPRLGLHLGRLLRPASTPHAQKLNDAIVRVANDPQIKERLEALAFDVTAAPLGETAAYVKSELAKWGKVVRDVGAKVD
jgi:hypothetical protein